MTVPQSPAQAGEPIPWPRGPATLFLDIDGVLNSAEWDRSRHRGVGRMGHFDPVAVARLNRLTDQTGAEIVVSSSWRQYGEDEVRGMLQAAGVTAPIVGCTPILDDGSVIMRPVQRGQEIRAWLDAHPTETYVILDDDDDMDGLRRHFVRTRHEVGLTDDDVRLACMVLDRRPTPTEAPSDE